MKQGIHEERTRVVLYLPYNNPAEADAVKGSPQEEIWVVTHPV